MICLESDLWADFAIGGHDASELVELPSQFQLNCVLLQTDSPGNVFR